MKYAALAVGATCVLLGGLWLLQGLGLVTIQPVLCVAECTPLEGPSTTWAVAGFGLAAVGLLALLYAVRQFRASLRQARL